MGIAIKNFVAKWKLDEQWLFCIDHINTTEKEYAIEHKYNVRFSIPTRKTDSNCNGQRLFYTHAEYGDGLEFRANERRVPSGRVPTEPIARGFQIPAAVAIRSARVESEIYYPGRLLNK